MFRLTGRQVQVLRLALIVSVFLCLSADALAEDYVPGELIIYIESDYWPVSISKDEDSNVVTGLSSLDSLNVAQSCQDMDKIYKGKAHSAQGYHYLQFPSPTNMDSVASAYEQDAHVRFATPNYLIEGDAIPNDSLYPPRAGDPGKYQWAHNMDHMMSEGAWDLERGDSTVLIQVIDYGVDWGHPDLVSNIWQNLAEDYDQDGHTIELVGGRWELDPGDLNEADDDSNGYPDDLIGWDFGDKTESPLGDRHPESDSGVCHGTIVAGVIAATTNNISGGAGTAWHCRIMPAKIYHPGFHAITSRAAIEAIYYGADNGARVMNMSFGVVKCHLLEEPLTYADTAADIVLVASAGNSVSSDTVHCPAMFPYVLAVAGVDSMDVRCPESNWANWVDVSAPGHNWTTDLSYDTSSQEYVYSYRYLETCVTSWCAPFVSGQAGLLRSYYPDSTNDQIMNMIKSSTDSIYHIEGNEQYEGKLGTGRINLLRPLALVASGTIETNTTWDGYVYVVDDVTIASSVTLTIAPGTVIRFKWGENIKLSVWGTLVANGTESDSIFFTSTADAPSDSDWSGIEVLLPGSAKLTFCNVEHAQTGINYHNSADDTVTHCRFRNNFMHAIRTENSSLFVDECLIEKDWAGVDSSEGYGILCHGANCTIKNTFFQGSLYGIKVQPRFRFDQPEPSIEECGFYNIGASGILSVASNPTIEKCCFKGVFGKAGIEVDRGDATVGKCYMASEHDSIFIGMLFENGAGGTIHRTTIWDYDTCAVKIIGSTTDPDFGNSDSIGCNWFEEPGSGFKYFRSYSSSTILAKSAYWDVNDWDTSGIREKIVGDVDINPILGKCDHCFPYYSDQCSDLSPSDPEFDACKIVAEEGGEGAPRGFSLSQNYPNPFNPQTVIKYDLPRPAHVKLTIYNVLGQKVRTMVDEYQDAGGKTLFWDGTDDGGKEVASGVYFFRLQAGEFEAVRQMVLLR